MTRKATTSPKPKGSTKEALVHKFFWQRPAKHDPKKMGCPFNIYDEAAQTFTSWSTHWE
jgi:hypothetical protein